MVKQLSFTLSNGEIGDTHTTQQSIDKFNLKWHQADDDYDRFNVSVCVCVCVHVCVCVCVLYVYSLLLFHFSYG